MTHPQLYQNFGWVHSWACFLAIVAFIPSCIDNGKVQEWYSRKTRDISDIILVAIQLYYLRGVAPPISQPGLCAPGLTIQVRYGIKILPLRLIEIKNIDLKND